MSYRSLDPAAIAGTVDLLCRRVERRFPDSGLAHVCRDLDAIARRTAETVAWIGRPILPLRAAVGLLLALLAAGAWLLAATVLRVEVGPMRLTEIVQALESGVNDVLFVGAAIFFLLTVEGRVKRRRALRAIHELRAIAHVIDMHQLTKDPEWVLDPAKGSALLPPRTLSRFELSRYLDYCSEMLAILGKVAALYVQEFEDGEAVAAVNEVEALTNDLSRKIWQKLMILYAMGPERSGS